MKIDNDIYSQAIGMALKVDFLTTSEELFLYASGIYSAMMWGRKVDERNKAIQEKDKSVK